MDAREFMTKTKTEVEKALDMLKSIEGLATQLGFPVVDLLLANTLEIKSNLLAALEDSKVQGLVNTFLTICPNGECRQWDYQFFEPSNVVNLGFKNRQDLLQYISGVGNTSLFSVQELTAFTQLFENQQQKLSNTKTYGMNM